MTGQEARAYADFHRAPHPGAPRSIAQDVCQAIGHAALHTGGVFVVAIVPGKGAPDAFFFVIHAAQSPRWRSTISGSAKG